MFLVQQTIIFHVFKLVSESLAIYLVGQLLSAALVLVANYTWGVIKDEKNKATTTQG
jgi:hypothetical protein